MNSLYSVEQDKNRWDYGGDVGIIPKQNIGSDYDTKQSLRENNARDDVQQYQLDANNALDVTQQVQINSNTEAIQRNESRDDSQQLQIDANKSEISRLDGEMPTLSIEGTTMIIGRRKDN